MSIQGLSALAVAELSADDLEVVSAAWTATLRLEYESADAVPNGVVTPDKTIRACNVPEYQPSTYDCIEARDLIIVDGLMREFFGAMGPTTFHRRNSTTNQIRGEIKGMEVVPGDTRSNCCNNHAGHGIWASYFQGRASSPYLARRRIPLRTKRWSTFFTSLVQHHSCVWFAIVVSGRCTQSEGCGYHKAA